MGGRGVGGRGVGGRGVRRRGVGGREGGRGVGGRKRRGIEGGMYTSRCVLRFVTTVRIFSMIVLRCEYTTVSTILHV